MAEQIKNLIAKWDATWPSPLVVSRQHDNGQFRINLVDYPEPENYENQNEEILETINYYLVVWMKQSEDGEMEKLAPIQLPGPYWLVNSPYTQLVQDIKFQFYATSSVTGYIAHSAQFKGMILESLSGSQQQSVIPEEMWDAYKQYIEDKIIGAGLATIDPTLSISGAAADAKAAGDALTAVNGRLQRDEIVISDKADAVYGGDTSDEFIELMPGKGMSSESWTYVNQSKRAASNPVLKSLSVVSASVSSGYTMYVYGNNVGIGGEINKIAGWVTTISLENVQYKYLCFIIKRTDEEVITSDDLSEVLTLSSYDEVLPYALERDLHTVSESVGNVNTRLSNFIGIIDFDLEKGNLNSGDERPVASSYNSGTRGRTPVDNPVNLFGNSIIKVESGYRIYPMYNAGDGLVNEGRWVTGEYVVPADSDVWFIISPTTETSGEVIPIETLKEQITIISGNPNSYEQRMSSIERAVSDGEGYMPEYYINHIAAKVEEINQASRFLNGVCFPFITDIHFKANSKNSKYLLKNILDKTACDFVVAGGDYGITRATAAESREIIGNLIDYASYIGHSRWFAINGNHDFTGTESLTWGETYNAIYRPSERWVTDGNVGGWFCIENPVQKTRIICLNSCCPSSFNSDTVMDGLVRIGYAQAKYLVDKLSDGDGYNIIVVSHIASDEAMSGYTSNMGIVQTILESFVAKSAGSSMASGQTLSYDFTSVTNSLIFHLSGHAHADESNVSNGVLSISTTCDAYYRDDGHGAAVGTITEQAFDVYCIDYDAETITAVRIGRGASRKWSFDGTVLSDATD